MHQPAAGLRSKRQGGVVVGSLTMPQPQRGCCKRSLPRVGVEEACPGNAESPSLPGKLLQ